MSQESEDRIVVRGHARKPLPPIEFLRECFDAQFFRGCLMWRTRPLSHFPDALAHSNWNKRFAGTEAGSKCARPDGKHRYRDVGLKIAAEGKAYLYSVHIIMWAMAGRPLGLGDEIDHKNRDAWDNRLRNLRRATPAQNMQNAGGHKNKKSGLPKWVYVDKTCYMAKVRINKKEFFLGNFHDPMDAHLTAFRKARKANGIFVNCGCDTPCQI